MENDSFNSRGGGVTITGRMLLTRKSNATSERRSGPLTRVRFSLARADSVARRHVRGRAGARDGAGADGQPDAVRRARDAGHAGAVQPEARTPGARPVGQPPAVRLGTVRAGPRAGRPRPDRLRLRAVPVRVRVRHQAVRVPGGRRSGRRAGPPETERLGRDRRRLRVHVQRAPGVRVRGRTQDQTVDGQSRAVRVETGQPREGRAAVGRHVGWHDDEDTDAFRLIDKSININKAHSIYYSV